MFAKKYLKRLSQHQMRTPQTSRGKCTKISFYFWGWYWGGLKGKFIKGTTRNWASFYIFHVLLVLDILKPIPLHFVGHFSYFLLLVSSSLGGFFTKIIFFYFFATIFNYSLWFFEFGSSPLCNGMFAIDAFVCGL